MYIFDNVNITVVSFDRKYYNVYTLTFYIGWEHWPDTCEFITPSVELWNRWIRLSRCYNRVYIRCPLYTHATPIGPCNLFKSARSML